MALAWHRAVFLLFMLSHSTYSFNVDVSSAIVYDGPEPGQYFGYSVALHSSGNKRWVLVGAPLTNVSKQFIRYGDVYKCEYGSTPSKMCVAMKVDNRAVDKQGDPLVEVEEKSGQWLGGTVYSSGEDGHALTCASRYIYRGLPPDTTQKFQYRWVLGRCFALYKDLSGVSSPILAPCIDKYKGNNFYGYCQAGISAVYTGVEKNIIMGAVGVTRWKGGLIHHSSVYNKFQYSAQDQIDIGNYMGYAVASGHFSDPDNTEVVGGAPRAEKIKGKVLIYEILENQLVVSSPLPQPKNIPPGTYFGSSLCSVDLNDDRYTDILVGAPYYTHVKDEGRVFVYLNNKQGALNLQEQYLDGDRKVNAHFGEAIAAVGDLNRDGFEDVAIGAPFEGDDGSGAVYIYHGSSRGIESQYRQKILGSAVKTGLKLFGSSISKGLDVDGNKYPDIAVGAYGSNNAVLLRTKKIVNVEADITLTRSQFDLESNESVCTLDSGKVHKCLNMTVCFKYEDNINTGSSGALQIKYSLELDKAKEFDALRRMFFVDETTKAEQFVVQGNDTIPAPKTYHCLPPRTVYIKDKDNIGDLGSLLTFDVGFSLPTQSCSGLCSVLNDYLPNTYRAVASFQKQCKDQVCVPDLAVVGSLVFSPSKYNEVIIGPVKEFIVQLTVSNNADDSAYYSKIALRYPADLNYVGPDQPLDCQRETGSDGNITATCTVGNPLLGKSRKTFGIKFTPGSIKKNFKIKVEATSQDKDADDKDNTKDFEVAVKFEADVEVTGSSKHGQVTYVRTLRDEEEVVKSLESIGPEVIQTITIRNRGPSVVDSSTVTLSFPALFHSSKPKSYLLYLLHVELVGGSGSCDAKVNPENIKAANETSTVENKQSRRRRRDTDNKQLTCRTASCQFFECKLGRLSTGDKVEIRLIFRLWENTLVKELESPVAVDLETTAKVKVPPMVTQPNEDNDQTTVITTAKPASTEAQEKKIPWWAILLSVLGGVLLLAAAAAILYKLGFFKRKRVKDISGPMEEAIPMNS